MEKHPSSEAIYKKPVQNMDKYSSSEDIYKQLVEDSEEDWLYGLVAFAVVEEQRIEWLRHYEKLNAKTPSEEEIRRWYEQQHPNVLLRAKGTAENTLKIYSNKVTELAIDDKLKGTSINA